MTYQDDPNRPPGELRRYGENERSTKMAWGTFAVVALLVVAEFMFYNSGGHGPAIATNTPAATQTAPTTGPDPTSPATTR